MINGLSRELGREKIRINTINLGWIFTERQIEEYCDTSESERHLAYLERLRSLKSKITPTDIANHILFYLSVVSHASFVHGCVGVGGWILE